MGKVGGGHIWHGHIGGSICIGGCMEYGTGDEARAGRNKFAYNVGAGAGDERRDEGANDSGHNVNEGIRSGADITGAKNNGKSCGALG